MKKLFTYVLAFAASMVLTTSFTSCSDDDDNGSETNSEKTALLQTITTQMVDATIYDTYKALADSAELLADQVSAMRESARTKSVTDAQVSKACALFKGARANYEKSEAFLLGAASQYNVDPHIDSWPLDKNALVNALNSTSIVNALDGEDGDAQAYGLLGQNALGFHGLEYILFKNGEARPASDFNGTFTIYEGVNGEDIGNVLGTFDGEYTLIFAKAVAGDLRNNCYILECGWNPESNASHAAYLDELEMNYTMSNGSSFGEDYKSAGNAGSSYSTLIRALSAIVAGDQGARGICDEVADQKIGRPYAGTTEDDINYIESPYSYNSITDFYNNITSIEDVWYGGMAKNRNTSKSLSTYFAKYHATEGAAVESAIATAKAEIAKMPKPFVKNRQDAQVKVAIEACHDLSDALNAANTAMLND